MESNFEIIDRKNDEEIFDDHPLSKVLNEFLGGMDDLRDAIYISIPSIAKKQGDEAVKCAKEIQKYAIHDGDVADIVTAAGPHAASKIIDTVTRLQRLSSSNALSVLERSLFVGLFSQYDVFIGRLLTGIYMLKPDLFKGISREISLSDLLEFDSLASVKLDMLDKEIDSFRRDSYIEQFSCLEKKFDIVLKKFKEWPDFVELGQRRNLMTHNGGSVSEQYLNSCDREGYVFEKRPAIGENLSLGSKYFDHAIATLSKVAFMLTHTLWRKLVPQDADIADKFLNRNIYDLLKQKKWALAAEFGSFGLSPSILKRSKEMPRGIRVINTAIALTRLGRGKDAVALLDTVDWSASIREFKLADAVLRNKLTEAQAIMRSIGKKGELVNQLAYHQWPLFQVFCDTKEFQDAYHEIYGIPFIEKAAQTANIAKDDSINVNKDEGTVSRKKAPNKGPIKLTKKAPTLKIKPGAPLPKGA
jgi:hypothetical protein